MQSFVQVLSADLTPSTVHTVFAVLRAVLAHAADHRLIAANPCSRVPLPRVERKLVVPPPKEHVIALADAIAPRYRLAVILGAMAGLREGEALGLTVGCAETLRRRIRVQRQAQNGAMAPLKSKASMRTVPADDLVLEEIARHMAQFPPGPGQVIITNGRGMLARRSRFGEAWRDAVASARTCGKPPAKSRGPRLAVCGEQCSDPAHCVPQGTRFHDLRH